MSPGDASDRFGEALALWTGSPLTDFAEESFAQSAITRLVEIRLAAIELRLDTDLALGRHGELVGQLRSLVAEHPCREHLRCSLMTALYRTGRQAEALDAYQDARRVLDDELGIQPSPELQELERAILQQDRVLDLPTPASFTVRADRERSVLVAVSDESRRSSGGRRGAARLTLAQLADPTTVFVRRGPRPGAWPRRPH